MLMGEIQDYFNSLSHKNEQGNSVHGSMYYNKQISHTACHKQLLQNIFKKLNTLKTLFTQGQADRVREAETVTKKERESKRDSESGLSIKYNI